MQLFPQFLHTEFPRQELPNSRQWNSWKKAVKLLCQPQTQTLKIRLGIWKLPQLAYSNWPAFIYFQSLELRYWDSTQNKWYKIPYRAQRQLLYPTYSIQTQTETAFTWTEHWRRTTITNSNNTITTHGYSTFEEPTNVHLHEVHQAPITEQSSDQLQSLIKTKITQYNDSSWSIKYIEFSPRFQEVLTDFINNKALAVGDVSFCPIREVGASAFVLSNKDGTEFIAAGGPTPGPFHTQSAYHSELALLLGISILTSVLCQITTSSPTITIACDNDSALDRAFSSKTDISFKQRSSDLLSTISDLWTKITALPQPVKVKGHSDELNRELSVLEQLNVMVDIKAKHFLASRSSYSIARSPTHRIHTPYLSIGQFEVTGQVAQAITSYMSSLRSQNALFRLNRLSPTSWDLIDHLTLCHFGNSSSIWFRLFRTKLIAHQLSVGSNLL